MNIRESFWNAIQAGAEKAVAADPQPLAQSHTMRAIDREVAKLPPFPLSAPMPEISTGRYLDKPCSRPQARYMPQNICWCGYLMGEHRI